MQEIKPMIYTLPAALAHMGSFGKPVFLKYDNGAIAAYVLAGGSIRHPVAVSLILSSNQGYIMGKYNHWEHRRLVIKDGLYRTRYALNNSEYEKIHQQINQFALEKHMPFKDLSERHRSNAMPQFFLSNS